MSSLGIDLPWPPKELSPNAKRRKHWSVYRPFTKSYRTECWALTKSELVKQSVKFTTIDRIIFHPPDRRRRDDDGIISQFKAGRDGIADALGVDDHTFRPVYMFGSPSPGGRVYVWLS